MTSKINKCMRTAVLWILVVVKVVKVVTACLLSRLNLTNRRMLLQRYTNSRNN